MSEMTKSALMNKIQKLSFAMCETQLFLDTHPNCRRALEYFHELTDTLAATRLEYQNRFGPITADEVVGDKWTWVMSPWPWHNDNDMREER